MYKYIDTHVVRPALKHVHKTKNCPNNVRECPLNYYVYNIEMKVGWIIFQMQQ